MKKYLLRKIPGPVSSESRLKYGQVLEEKRTSLCVSHTPYVLLACNHATRPVLYASTQLP
jgi:hypothetical protein